MFGIALLSSGIATLNQYMERDLDAADAAHCQSAAAVGKTSAVGSAGVWRQA